VSIQTIEKRQKFPVDMKLLNTDCTAVLRSPDRKMRGITRFLSGILLLAALFILSPDVQAQGDKFSFRLRGLGQGLHGLVDDLYSDLSFNPMFIHRYEGTTLYTNISNLQGKSEQRQFNQDEADYTLLRSTDIFPSNLVGMVTDRFGSPMGIFWESQGYNLSLSDATSGEVFTSLTAGNMSGNTEEIGTDFSGNSLTWIGLIKGFGVSLSYHKLGFELDYNDRNYSGTFEGVDSLGSRITTSSLSNMTQTSLDMPNSMLAFSIGKVIKAENSEVSIAAGRRPERVVFNANDLFGMFKEPFFGGGEGKLSKLEEKDLGYMEIGLKTYFLNVRYKTIQSSLNSLQQNNFLFKYERYGLPLEIEAIDETVQDSLAVSGAARKLITNTHYGLTEGDGDGNLNNIEFGAGFERHINNFNTMIALGAKINYVWGDLDFVFSPGRLKETQEINVEIGDPAEEADSYTRIISDNRTQVTNGTIKGLLFSIPVGIETKITKKLTLRLGARSVIPFAFETTWETQTEDGVDELIETSEDQTNYTPGEVFPLSSFRETVIDGKSINLDSYHFGARYDINDYIGIDFLHFAKVTELDTWWLSVVLRY